MRLALGLVFALLLALPAPSAGDGRRPADEARPRVEHHLREVEHLVQHFEDVMARACPRFETAAGWNAYLDDEIEQVVLLLAHLEQAWVEAKLTSDDDVRRAAKAPRRQRGRVQPLFEKLQGCANGHGARLEPGQVWRRVEQEVPRRQAEIALPQ